MAVLLGRMGGHGKGPDELGLIEAATQVDAQTCTLRLELAYRHRLQLHTVSVVAGRRRIILCRCGCVGLRSLKESLDGAWQRPVREELVVIIPHAAFVEAAAASGQVWAIFLDGLARVSITQPVGRIARKACAVEPARCVPTRGTCPLRNLVTDGCICGVSAILLLSI